VRRRTHPDGVDDGVGPTALGQLPDVLSRFVDLLDGSHGVSRMLDSLVPAVFPPPLWYSSCDPFLDGEVLRRPEQAADLQAL
jgi:hypothetical protein